MSLNQTLGLAILALVVLTCIGAALLSWWTRNAKADKERLHRKQRDEPNEK
jgi:cell division protein FtsL